MRVAIHYADTPGMSGIKRYSLELLAALRRRGVAARGSRTFYHEWRLRGRPVGGLVTATIGRYLPVVGADLVHSTHYMVVPHGWGSDVTTIHDVMPVAQPELYALSARAKARHEAGVRRALKGWVVTDTEATRREVLRLFPEAEPSRVVPVHLGLDALRFHPDPVGESAPGPLRPGRLTVAVFMNPEWRKRVDLLLRAAVRLPFVHVLHAGSEYTIQGQGGALQRNRDAARDLQREGRYEALGAVTDAQLRELFARADVVVHPSQAEGFSLPPLEALACGARVLASDIAPHREVLGDAARYFPLDEDGIVRALEDAWDGHQVRAQRFAPPEASVAHARRFTWDETARQTSRVYERVVADGPA